MRLVVGWSLSRATLIVALRYKGNNIGKSRNDRELSGGFSWIPRKS